MCSFVSVGMNCWGLALQTFQYKYSQIHCQRKCSHIWKCVLKKFPHCCCQIRFSAIRCAFLHRRPQCTSQFTVPCANTQVSTMVSHSWDGRTKSLCSWNVSPCRGITVAEQSTGEEWKIWWTWINVVSLLRVSRASSAFQRSVSHELYWTRQ